MQVAGAQDMDRPPWDRAATRAVVAIGVRRPAAEVLEGAGRTHVLRPIMVHGRYAVHHVAVELEGGRGNIWIQLLPGNIIAERTYNNKKCALEGTLAVREGMTSRYTLEDSSVSQNKYQQ